MSSEEHHSVEVPSPDFPETVSEDGGFGKLCLSRCLRFLVISSLFACRVQCFIATEGDLHCVGFLET